MTDDLKTKFCSQIASFDMEDQEVVAVAVSGGPDSIALCALLAEWASINMPKLKIHALTVDHRLRPDSTTEAQGVGKILKPFKNVTHQILTWQHKHKPSSRVQEEAREARYILLQNYMREHNIKYLFVGHHQADQAETFLFRLAKGSGLDGLAGIAQQQKLQKGAMLCRPLLEFSKEELISYCKANEIKFYNDPSNNSDAFARVRMRKIMSGLEKEGLTPERLGATAKRIARARKALEKISEKAFKDSLLMLDTNQTVLKYSVLKEYPEEIALRVIIYAMEYFTKNSSYPPRLERVENLFVDLMKPQAFRKRTLGGIIFERKDRADKVILISESYKKQNEK